MKMVDQKRSKNNVILNTYGNISNVLLKKLLRLRALIYDVADAHPDVGNMEESLKWGQPSYVAEDKTGTPIRLGMEKKAPGTIGLYVNCSTTLIETIKHIYGDKLRYDGNRGILFDIADEIPEDIMRHAIELALTYHIR